MVVALRYPGMSVGYQYIVHEVVATGARVSPRGLPTRELNDVLIQIDDPYDALPTGTGRDLNLTIGAVEALQLIGGFSRPELNVAASRNFMQFMEPDGSFWGAYGNRIGDQVHHVVRKLHNDPDTRQAIVTLWDPRLDNERDRKDYPCTIMHAFRIRDGFLSLAVTMRSNDVILGLAYDIFQFTQLQIAVAHALSVPPGEYTHHAVSLHLYERDLHYVDKLKPGTITHVSGIGRPGDTFGMIQGACESLAEGIEIEEMTDGEAWYLEQIRKIKK